MAISGLSVFGGGYLNSFIPDGATYKSVSASANGVILDVQEKGVFSISGQGNTDLVITVDGVQFSGSSSGIKGVLIGAAIDSGALSAGLAYSKSLKIELTNHVSGSVSVGRISS